MKETKSKKKQKITRETKPKTPSEVNLFNNRIIRLNKTVDKETSEQIVEQLLQLDATKSKEDIIFYINSSERLQKWGKKYILRIR